VYGRGFVRDLAGDGMQILATRLAPDVSITLVQQDGAWRFQRGGPARSQRPLPPPSGADRAFATSDAALEFFRSVCPAP
jgi:hypothetical protein